MILQINDIYCFDEVKSGDLHFSKIAKYFYYFFLDRYNLMKFAENYIPIASYFMRIHCILFQLIAWTTDMLHQEHYYC